MSSTLRTYSTGLEPTTRFVSQEDIASGQFRLSTAAERKAMRASSEGPDSDDLAVFRKKSPVEGVTQSMVNRGMR